MAQTKKYINYLNKIGQWLFLPLEYLLMVGTKKDAIISINDYPELNVLALHTDIILNEYQSFVGKNDILPFMDELSYSQKKIVSPKHWSSIFLKIYGREIPEIKLDFPKTAEFIRDLPGVKTAFFSVFAPKTHLSAHRGPYKGVIRYHLGLIIPENCGIRIDGKDYTWAYGKPLLFDDTYIHEAWNNSDEHRVVLFLDVERKLPLLQQCLNRVLLFLISKSPFVSEIYSNATKR